ncbi:hypothetical protein PQX77_014603, partial [Marasmius sp. AFHP31]
MDLIPQSCAHHTTWQVIEQIRIIWAVSSDWCCSRAIFVLNSKLIRYFLNWGLLGVLCVKVFLYYLAFRQQDGWAVKILVYGLFILEIVQTIVITCDVFVKYGLNFGKVEGLTAMRHNWFSIPTISAINGTAVQLSFTYLIAKLSESRTLGVLVAILAITGGTAGIVAGLQSKIINNLMKVAVHARTALM